MVQAIGRGVCVAVVEPLRRWVAGDREGVNPADVWRAAGRVPFDLVQRGDKRAIARWRCPCRSSSRSSSGCRGTLCVPATRRLVSIAYSAVLDLFAGETACRPIVREVAEGCRDGLTRAGIGVPLRWKLLGALPLINVITGVVVSGLSAVTACLADGSRGERAGGGDRGIHDLAGADRARVALGADAGARPARRHRAREGGRLLGARAGDLG